MRKRSRQRLGKKALTKNAGKKTGKDKMLVLDKRANIEYHGAESEVILLERFDSIYLETFGNMVSAQ